MSPGKWVKDSSRPSRPLESKQHGLTQTYKPLRYEFLMPNGVTNTHRILILNYLPLSAYAKSFPRQTLLSTHNFSWNGIRQETWCKDLVSTILRWLFSPPKDGAVTRYYTQYQTLVGIAIGRNNNSNYVNFYISIAWSACTTGDYALNPGCQTNSHLGIIYNRRIFICIYSSYLDPSPEPYPPRKKLIYLSPKFDPVHGTSHSIPLLYKNSIIPE